MSELHKFLFDGAAVRGMVVRLTDGWRELLRRRGDASAHPPAVRALLGEMAAAATLMQANIKFDGTLILQVYGDGPVKLAVAQSRADLSFRATATVTGEIGADASLPSMLNLHGGGRCSITLDAADRKPGQQPYQGIVPLHGDRREPLQQLSQVLEHYMLQSEQLDTRLVLAANDEVAAGLLIQRLPVQGDGNLAGGARNEDEIGINEDFNRIAALAATLTQPELLTLDVETLLRRLFWDELVTRFEPQHPVFACSCSRARVGNMLKSLGRTEVEGIVAERGDVEVVCEFCGQRYEFDAVDVGQLFTAEPNQPPHSSELH